MKTAKRDKKPSMSFLTSLGLSANNLRTKKGRTILTAFAGSIGIIGIALILALSSGVNDYIQSIQEDTLSEYPLQITGSELDLTSLLVSMTSTAGSEGDTAADDTEISVTRIMTSMLSQVNSNDLASLKEYIESGDSDILDYVKAVEYSYDVEPLIYLQEGDTYQQVNPDTSLSSSSSMLSAFMSAGSASFYVMPENENLYIDQYELKAGHWPENYNECVLVLTADGSISDYTLYSLGLRDYSELAEMIEQYNSGGTGTDIDDIGTYTYEDVLGITFKVVCNADLYVYDSEYDLWVDKSDNEAYMSGLIAAGEDLVVVGIVQPSANAIGSNLTSGINYPVSLIYHIAEQAASSDVVRAQLENPAVNIFTGEEFGESTDNFDLSSILTIDGNALSNVFSDVGLDLSKLDFDLSALNIDLSSLDLSALEFDLDAIDWAAIEIDWSDLEIDPSTLDLRARLDDIISDPDFLSAWWDTILSEDLLGWNGDGSAADDFTAYLQSVGLESILLDILNDPALAAVTVDRDGLASVLDEMINGAGDDGEIDSTTIADAISDYLSEHENPSAEELETVISAIIAVESGELSTQMVIDTILDYISDNAVISIRDDGIQTLMDRLAEGYLSRISGDLTGALLSGIEDLLSAALYEDRAAASETDTETIRAAVQEQIGQGVEQAMSQIMAQIGGQLTAQISTALESVLSDAMGSLSDQIANSLADSFSIDADSLTEAFEFTMNTVNLTDLLTSMNLSSSNSYESNLSTLGYADLSDPSQIDIYPIDFASKEKVVAILDDYNLQMEQAGESGKVISYTDMVATMMSSVTTIIDTVSYVLIAFVAVSLLVSCIMISIITQISVMERTKEIGILRAMGASKANISQVFNAETFIIGACSGLIGVGVTELLIFPINAIIHALIDDESVNAVLPWNYALILVVISIVITVFSGLVPALKAAKQDPVTALRTE